jgi:hypothetical protein
MNKIKRGKDRKAMQIFGMPFAVIFSIFLIIAFLVVAFFAIDYFLDIKRCATIGTFLDDFQEEIRDTWQSQKTEFVFTRSMPSKIEYVCIADLNKDSDASGKEKQIYEELQRNAKYEHNFFLYPQRAVEGCLASIYVEHINATELTNPYCFENKNSKINIKIEKGFFDLNVKISRV